MKQLLLLTVLIIVLASCEKPDDPSETFSFNGDWEYRIDPNDASYQFRLVINDDRLNFLVNDYNNHIIVESSITSSLIENDTLRFTARYTATFDTYFTAVVFFKDNPNELWMYRNAAIGEYPTKIRYDVPPIKFIK